VADDFELYLDAKALAAAARDVKAAGKEVQKELYSALERASKPLQEIAIGGADVLPQSGGRDVRVTRMKKTGTVDVDGHEFVRRARVKTKRTKGNESLADRVRAARFVVRLRGGRNPGVKLVATARGGKKVALGELDRGNVRKPLFGDKRHWFDQPVTSGWWTDSLTGAEALGAVRREVLQAVDAVIRRMRGGA
jgi:hypothetical protein